MNIECWKINITGVVQGVGFRPFVYRLAREIGVRGYVKNIGADVNIIAEGSADELGLFVDRIRENHPVAAKIADIAITCSACGNFESFSIYDSDINFDSVNNVSVDIAICDDCRRELFNPADRRYQYPLINCTNCGPRYSIIKNVPYDRRNTTMSVFEMCDECAHEYNDPGNRRFHAQPVSCHKCGPQVVLTTIDGAVIAEKDNAIKQAAEMLKFGKILAVKGIGGYHLVCNAADANVVKELRLRKKRDEKPFAIMVDDVNTARLVCKISPKEEELLASPASPIVLLEKFADTLPDEIAPGNKNIGVMLPYTPIQLQLFRYSELCYLVMTSANIIDEPIVYVENEILPRLNGIADFVLSHNRDIYTRVDDSVVRIFNDHPYYLRRARGYVPGGVNVDFMKNPPSVLACGGHLKNTFCVNDGGNFFVSHHIGDMENYETFFAYENSISLMKDLLGVEPEYVVCDLHPDYMSTKYAMHSGLPVIAVQHHRAHIAGCMAENNYAGDVIGVAFDGTGYGDDGNIWGSEFFIGNINNLQRAAQIEYVDLPAEPGRATPWKSALGYLLKYGIDTNVLNVDKQAVELLSSFVKQQKNIYRTSSMGRLFDAVSVIAGVRNTASYEGQAAIELEFAANECNDSSREYPFDIIEGQIIKLGISGIIKGVVEDKNNVCSVAVISANFHETIAQMILQTAMKLREINNINHVALSGGVFQNIYLLRRVNILLSSAGFHILQHKILPANDGGLSFGQAVLALYRKGE